MITIVFALFLSQLSFADEGPQIRQLDVRRRLTLSVKIPETVRLRVRASLEYRYKVKIKQ